MQTVGRRLQFFFALFIVLTGIGTFGFMFLENLSFSDAFYYNIVTFSTVGYGDIHPTHPASRLLAIFLIIMGGATFLEPSPTARNSSSPGANPRAVCGRSTWSSAFFSVRWG